MKVALIGASGNVGSRLVRELVSRGHEVTAIARNTDRIEKISGVTPVKGDAGNRLELANLLRGHDAVISAVRFVDSDPAVLIGAVKDAGVRRYLVVGGAGSLEAAPGVLLLNSPDFPSEYKPEAEKGAAFLAALKGEPKLDWTFLSPSAVFEPGQRTGAFRLGTDQLLTGAGGSSISFEDFAVAMVDELEKPVHTRQRFTVGY